MVWNLLVGPQWDKIMITSINGNWGGMNIPIINPLLNSPNEVLEREGVRVIFENVPITGNNLSYNINIFKLIGSVMVLDQYAIITEAIALTNMTDVYADLWDGTNSVKLTNGNPGGMTLSAAPVGTLFTKDLLASSPYSINTADQCRMLEPGNRDIGRPFIVTQKNGVNTYIRFNYTTNTNLDMKMTVYFKYKILNSGTLEAA